MMKYHLENGVNKDTLIKNETVELSGTLERSDTLEQPGTVELLEEGVSLEHLNASRRIETAAADEKMIVGEPYEDMETWSPQAEAYSCAIACQEMIAEQLTGEDISEEKMIAVAREQGWYDPESGTAMADVGRVLETMGMQVERETGASVDELAWALERGKVICGVNNMILAEPALAALPGQKANHAVQVIGIDASDANNIEVLLNDPGAENGRGIRHSLDTFLKAWNTGGNFMATVYKEE